MLANETNSSFVRKKSKLSLRLRSLNSSNANCDNSTRKLSNQALHHNQITNGSADDPDDNLDDFKSPKKFEDCPKKVKRKDIKPYRYPGDVTCTQDILIDAYRKAKEDDFEYRSEDEFVIFQKIKQSKKEKQILDETNSADKEKEKNDNESEKSLEHKFVEPVLPLISNEQKDKVDKKCDINKSLRKELKNIKINNVIIDDSEDEVIPCSQKVVHGNFFKIVKNHTAEAKILANLKNENADSKSSMRSGIFWSNNCSIRLLYSEEETDKGTVYFIPKQNCTPISLLASDQDITHNIPKIDNWKALKDEVLNKDNISVDSKNNNVIQQENDKFSNVKSSMYLHDVLGSDSNVKSSMNLHDVLGSDVKCKPVESALDKSYAQTSESQNLQVVEKISHVGWDESQMSEEIFDSQPSQSNEAEFKKISKGLSRSKVDETIEAETFKFSSRLLTSKKCRPKKLWCRYVRKLRWKSKYLKRKYKVSKVSMTRSGVRFRSK